MIRPPRKGVRRVLRNEPYDPDARDADNDGVVQEYTVWERPGGTFIVDANGNLLGRGVSPAKMPGGSFIVDKDKKRVGDAKYPQKNSKVPAAPIQSGNKWSPLGPSLAEMGLLSVGMIANPVVEPPASEADIPTPEVPDLMPEVRSPEEPKKPYKVPPPPLAGRVAELADDANGDWTKFQELLDKEGYVVFDYETTGLTETDMPTQIGAVKIKDGEVVDRLNVYMNPEIPLQGWSAENLKDPDGNMLTDEYLQNSPSMAEAHEQFNDFLGNGIAVSYNYPFDEGILRRVVAKTGDEVPVGGSLDALELARQVMPKSEGGPSSHKLKDLSEFLGIKLDKAHTADADAEATAEVLRATLQRAVAERVDGQILNSEYQRKLQVQKNEQYAADMKKYLNDMAEYERNIIEGG